MSQAVRYLLLGFLLLSSGCRRGVAMDTPYPPSPTSTVSLVETPSPSPTATSHPSPTPQFYEEGVIGHSVEGRPLVAHRFGWGEVKLVLLGDIHGGTEENTYHLMEEMIAYYREDVRHIPSHITLWIIPTLNPDGLTRGTRFNARGVDLNRNADTNRDGCSENDWQPDIFDSEGWVPGGGGSRPFSEPESIALRDFIADAKVIISYHSQGGMVVAGGCGEGPSRELTRLLAQATGYQEVEAMGYPVTGSMMDYFASLGLAAADVELSDKVDTELERNLRGVEAVMEWVGERSW